MSIGTIISWLLKLIGLFKGGSSSRIKLDVRSEKSIEDERKRLDKLYARMNGIDNELRDTIRRIVKAKKNGDINLESRLNDKRDMLFEQFRTAKREYDTIRRRMRLFYFKRLKVNYEYEALKACLFK